jgi:hypothetical protein
MSGKRISGVNGATFWLVTERRDGSVYRCLRGDHVVEQGRSDARGVQQLMLPMRQVRRTGVDRAANTANMKMI